MATERDLFANFDRMRREMDQLFGDFFERSGLITSGVGFVPAVDVYYLRTPARVAVVVEAAGIDLQSLSIKVQGRELMISGERKLIEQGDGIYQQLEIERGGFRRCIDLHTDVDAKQATASYEDGVLRIEIPLLNEDEEITEVKLDLSR